jgi:S-adenosylmethionine/arginine decarboxylase-like enzyme
VKHYGKELILDIHNCNPSTFNRKSIRNYFKELCELIEMERCKLCWWDDYGVPPEEQETEPHLKGTTAVQFIKTSNITIHTLDLMRNVYLNIFSCKDFDAKVVKYFSEKWFEGKIVKSHVIERR